MAINRRRFLGGVGTVATSRAADGHNDRPQRAMLLRKELAERLLEGPIVPPTINQDRLQIPNFAALFSKGFPHFQNGEVDPVAYATLLRAVDSGEAHDFAAIARGSGRPLVNPRAAFAFSLEGGDPQAFAVPPPPSFSSAEAAAEMAELYWMALLRDIPFDQYSNHPLVAKACADLNQLEDYRGKGPGDPTTPANLFREPFPRSPDGPMISQFLLRPIPSGSSILDQKARTPMPGVDFLDTYNEWLQLQTGVPPWREYSFDPIPRYLRNGRDLAEWVHYDYLHQGFLNAGLTLIDMGPSQVLNMNQYWSEQNPYKHSKSQYGFVTFGMAEVVDWVCRVTTAALKSTWYNKWVLHLRLRPEAFGGRIFLNRSGGTRYPLHPQIMNSAALVETEAKYRTSLLPQAYPEGCPLHPAYPGGHGTVAGACTTVLKALFEEDQPVPDVVVPNDDGTALIPRPDLGLTVGEELNKLAWNIAAGRMFAGIHYRSDSLQGLLLGEKIAVRLLEDLIQTLPEQFPGYRFRGFMGNTVTIQPR